MRVRVCSCFSYCFLFSRGDLFPTLLKGIQSGQALTVSRSFSVMSEVLRDLQSSRLPAARDKFEKLTQHLLPIVQQEWMDRMQNIANTLRTAPQPISNGKKIMEKLLESQETVIILSIISLYFFIILSCFAFCVASLFSFPVCVFLS